MADYKKMYAILCGAIDDAIDELSQFPFAHHSVQQLQNALYRAETIFIDTSLYAEEIHGQKVIQLKADHETGNQP